MKLDERIIRIYKVRNRIRGYIMRTGVGEEYLYCTGKPSDTTCLCWIYGTLEEAERCAEDQLSCWHNLSVAVL